MELTSQHKGSMCNTSSWVSYIQNWHFNTNASWQKQLYSQYFGALWNISAYACYLKNCFHNISVTMPTYLLFFRKGILNIFVADVTHHIFCPLRNCIHITSATYVTLATCWTDQLRPIRYWVVRTAGLSGHTTTSHWTGLDLCQT